MTRDPAAAHRPPMRLWMALLLLLLPVVSARAQAVLTGGLGATSRDHFRGGRFAWSGGLYLKFDDMVLIGAQSGRGTVAGSGCVPIAGSAMVRLPIGRIVLPVATGDLGYALGHDAGFFWRGGGGFDIRNGRRSSFLVLGGYERQKSNVGWYGRLGLLLEM